MLEYQVSGLFCCKVQCKILMFQMLICILIKIAKSSSKSREHIQKQEHGPYFEVLAIKPPVQHEIEPKCWQSYGDYFFVRYLASII